ncbi:hypothetical protein CKO28_06790 [Rhodovibrio sodomensis]|uniref:Uncharacterized protein n=1 Tax=Rhodovibrio sodomensis TaxID=1088 RepID=A0ABS1DBY4_9PROT|nr:hypothetical protein [Rhodovibrio sodomensis]MBK1667739.1 hypothetical protein [Rhodovibrio sodomensis]
MPSPAITVHSLDHARAALDAARRAGVSVTLLSAPGAAAYVGPGWFVQLLNQLSADERAALAGTYLDCGPRPGDALAAYRAGVSGVIFTGRSDVAEKLRALAQAHGTAFRTDRPDALDLLDLPAPDRALANYLRTIPGHGR